jgi:hypothetical protein
MLLHFYVVCSCDVEFGVSYKIENGELPNTAWSNRWWWWWLRFVKVADVMQIILHVVVLGQVGFIMVSSREIK